MNVSKSTVQGRSRKRFFSNRNNKGYLFILPFFLIMLTFQLYPLLYTLNLSFTSPVNLFENEYVGLANYQRLFTNPIFFRSIFNTWFIWLMNFIPQLVFALLLAVILYEWKVKGKDVFGTLYFLPNLVTAASIGVLFAVLLDWQNGTLNHILLSMGVVEEPIYWLQKKTVTQATVSFIQWWQWFGYTMIIFMAGLSSISEELYEAAYIDGATRFQVFFRITFPLLRPIMLYVLITSLIGGLQIFDIPRVLTDGRGGPDNALTTMVLYLYNQAFKNFNVGYAASVAYTLFFMILFFSIFTFRFMSGKKRSKGGSL
ncbi:carbohydrate ABC transporter permease [Salinispira pacifica]|uniref:Putative alpha-xyloside ABC transporter, permease component n=1 Tax=Salinispira pacifica TaxID=1307761 RepID=V5WJB8_9SPIO|nr:sugar ABC transporter permease [Salinispira pacifica]AHC15873.1 putative alpha-xyloside ABC transporter, permease component [Salinispira pacifica]